MGQSEGFYPKLVGFFIATILFMPISQRIFGYFILTAMLATALSYSKIYAFHILFVAAWGSFFYEIYTQKVSIKTVFTAFVSPKLLLFFPASILWFSAHIMIANDKSAVIQHLIQLFFGTSIIFLFNYFTDKNTILLQRVLGIIAFVIGANMLLALLEMTGFVRYPISDYSPLVGYFGKTLKYYHIVEMASVRLSPIQAEQLIASTPTGFYYNPNDCATVTAFAFPFVLLHKNKVFSFVGILAIVLISVATSARLIFIALWLMWLLSFYFINKKNWANYLIAGLLLVGSLTNGYTLLAGKWRQLNEVSVFAKVQMERPDSIGDNSVNIRKELITIGLNTVKENCGIGIGGGNMSSCLTLRGGIGNHKIKVLHNFWLEWLVEGGFIAALAFACWYLLLLFRLGKEYHYESNKVIDNPSNNFVANWNMPTIESDKGYYIAAILVALIGFTVSAIAQGTCIYFLPMYCLFALAIRLAKAEN